MEQKEIKKDIICKIIHKEIKKGKNTYIVYSALTEKGNWFDVIFAKDVIIPTKNDVIKVKAENWFTKYKKDADDKYILDKNGNRIKKLVIKAIDEILDLENYPDRFKQYDLDTDI